MNKKTFLSLLLAATTLTGFAQTRTTQATLFREFKPSTITLKSGKKLKQPLTNVFLKNSSLVYLQGEYTMEANMDLIQAVEFENRKYINIDNHLAYLIDSVGGNSLYRIDIFDMEAYKAQLRNNINISNLDLSSSDMISTSTIDLNNEEDYKFPVVPRFYYFYNGECFKVHEREISRRLPNDKDLKRKYKTIIGLDSFSWTDNESLVQLLKAITTNN